MTSPAQHKIWIFSLPAANAALTIAFLLTVVATQPAQAQTFNVIHTFTGGQDGGKPYAGLTIDRAGNLYGTAVGGGAGYGTVYKLTHHETERQPIPDKEQCRHFEWRDGNHLA